MSGFKSEDRAPMAAAILVVILANIVSYLFGLVIYMTILAAPLAIGAFLLCRYLLHGSALPDTLANQL